MITGAEAPIVDSWDAFWAAILGPLSMLIIAVVVNLTRKIEGKVIRAVENGTVQSSIRETVKGALDEEVQPRLDKIEAGVWTNRERLEELERARNQGQGQHFRPPNQVTEDNSGERASVPVRHVVPGTQPERKQ